MILTSHIAALSEAKSITVTTFFRGPRPRGGRDVGINERRGPRARNRGAMVTSDSPEGCEGQKEAKWRYDKPRALFLLETNIIVAMPSPRVMPWEETESKQHKNPVTRALHAGNNRARSHDAPVVGGLAQGAARSSR